MRGPEILIPLFVLSIPIIAILTRSEIGRAIADAIRHNSGAGQGADARAEVEQMRADIDQLRADIEDLHSQLLETHERLDFAERLLAKPQDAERLRGA